LLVTCVIFGLLALVRGTQAVVLLRGIIILVVATVLLTSFLQLPAFSWLLRNSLPALLIAVPVIFAPEIRRALERLGGGRRHNINTREAEIEQVVEAIAVRRRARLSERPAWRAGRHRAPGGAERPRRHRRPPGRGCHRRTAGTNLLPHTPLHDGGRYPEGSRSILAGRAIMPLTSGENITDARWACATGRARHQRSQRDAVAVVVSEETGAISVAHNGRMIQRLDAPRLRHILTRFTGRAAAQRAS